VYNEAESLGLLQAKLYDVMENVSREYEIIYVDDGSQDASLAVLKELKKHYPRIKIISFKENRGQSTALFVGFRAASGDWLITLDSDLQNPPEEITKLLKFKDEFDFITGVRQKRKDSHARKISSQIARGFRWLILHDTTKDTGCSLRAFKREIVERLPFFKNFHRFFTFLVKSMGFKVKEVCVAHHPREFGISKYGTLKRTREGIFDLWGVLWLKRRLIYYETKPS
jgi:glycosyltransferase involved in cell wall biosynthesis